MGFDKKEMIEQLKFEIEMIERGGIQPLSSGCHTHPRKSSVTRSSA